MISRISGSYWLSKGLLVLMSQLSNLIFGFLNFYFLLRLLSKYDYGVWTLFISVITFFELIKNGFIVSPLVRYLIDSKKEEHDVIQSSSLGLNGIFAFFQIAVAFGVSIFIEGVWVDSDLKYLFLVLVFSIILQVPLTHFSGIQQAHMNFKANLYSNLARQFSLFVSIMFFYLGYWQPTLFKLGIAYVCSVLLAVIVAYAHFQKYRMGSFRISKDWFSRLSVYGKYTFGTNISSMVLRSVDTWMLGALISPVAVTIYNPAVRIANIIEVPTVSLSSVFFPKLLSRYSEEGDVVAKDLYEKSVGALLALLFPVVVVIFIFSEGIIHFVAGDGFEETVDVLRVTMLTGLIIPFNRQIGVMLDAIGKAKVSFYFVLRNALINIVLCYFFVLQFGVIGAAYAMLTTFCLSFGYNQWYVSRNYNISLGNIFKFSLGYYRQFFKRVFFLS